MAKFHRGLEEEYIKQLRSRGSLSFLRNTKYIGKDIDIQIRDNYLNLYYKGASLLMFKWRDEQHYSIEISEAYFSPEVPAGLLNISCKVTKDKKGKERLRVYQLNSTSINTLKKYFSKIVLQLKRNIRYLGKGQENSFEQLFIENNLNRKNSPEFIIVDRQVVLGGLDRLDLIGLSKIANSDEYRLNLIELKYGEDRRIPDVYSKQLNKYYEAFLSDYPHIAKEYEEIIKQKIKINRWPYPRQEFKISREPATMRKIAVLGNIRANHPYIKEAVKDLDSNSYCVVKNNVLKEKELDNLAKCN